MKLYPFWAKKLTRAILAGGDPPHLCGELWLRCDSDAWYNVRVAEQFPYKCRELCGSYPSTCSVIGLDNALQLNSTKKMQTKNHANHCDLFTDVFRQIDFRQVIFLQVVCVFLFIYFFLLRDLRRLLQIFFSALIDGYDETPKRKAL